MLLGPSASGTEALDEPAGHLRDLRVVPFDPLHVGFGELLQVTEDLLVEHVFLPASGPDAPGVVVDNVSQKHLAVAVEAELELDVDQDDVFLAPGFLEVEEGVESLGREVDHDVLIDEVPSDQMVFEVLFADGRRAFRELRVEEDHPAVREVELDQGVVPGVVLPEELHDQVLEDGPFRNFRAALEVRAVGDPADDHLEGDHVQMESREARALPLPDEVRPEPLAVQELEHIAGCQVRDLGLVLHDRFPGPISGRNVVLALDDHDLRVRRPADDLRLAFGDNVRVLQFCQRRTSIRRESILSDDL